LVRKPVVQIKRPAAHHLIIASYVATPFVNVLLLMVLLRLALPQVLQRISLGYGPLATVWLLTAPLAGASLYLLNRFSWYAFLAHASLIIVDSFLVLAFRPLASFASITGAPLLLFLAGNVLRMLFVGYVLQKNFRAPYLQILSRSFRETLRVPIRHQILLDGVSLTTSDLSPGGCFVPEPLIERRVGDRLGIRFECDGTTVRCAGAIVRTTPEGFGVRFAGLSFSAKRAVRRMLRNRYALRYDVDLPARFAGRIEVRECRIVNISRSGCYVNLDSAGIEAGEAGSAAFLLRGETFLMPGRVVWVSGVGESGKPPGLGFRFSRGRLRLARAIRRESRRWRLTR
jgi:hypothetical protein